MSGLSTDISNLNQSAADALGRARLGQSIGSGIGSFAGAVNNIYQNWNTPSSNRGEGATYGGFAAGAYTG